MTKGYLCHSLSKLLLGFILVNLRSSYEMLLLDQGKLRT
jgi:hypothetical protein